MEITTEEICKDLPITAIREKAEMVDTMLEELAQQLKPEEYATEQ